MKLSASLQLTLRSRIRLLAALKFVTLVLAVVAGTLFIGAGIAARGGLVLAFLAASVAFGAWEQSQRRQFVREARLPTFLGAKLMAKEIAKRIEKEMEYPGQIRVNVIRETRSVEYAK